MKCVIINGKVFDPSQQSEKKLNLVIEKGKILALEEKYTPQKSEKIFDANGLHVFPGFIDGYAHCGEPGFEYKEDLRSFSQAANKAGYTSVCCTPKTSPVNDNASTNAYIISRAKEIGLVDVFPIAALTKNHEAKQMADIGDLSQSGAVALSHLYTAETLSSGMLRRAMEYALSFNLPILSTGYDKTLCVDGVMHEGNVSTRLGLKGMPALSEEILLSRDLMLAALTGSKLHVAHVSSAAGVDLIRKAKKQGVQVTAGVSAYHLFLTDEALCDYNPNSKIYPPLRTQRDQEALLAALNDGTLDIVVSNHEPHAVTDKEHGFDFSPFGASSIDVASLIVFTLVKEKKLSLKRALDALTASPARIYGLKGKGSLQVGANADICLIDLDEEYTLQSTHFASRSRNAPQKEWRLQGKVKGVFKAGHHVCEQ
ncbi:MAG: dihydroorotase [Deltaproteobacteria bacterium CG11_big_fil_rev_8_21_14_0_20_42_23]|nr:MAG: dihydroorotase [Deltaproteobacteria bacterium CG11_big_fil_rev_8_21_14_0_20_42_23]PJC64376.1 MAG: dihydroorotase [Deltaproteobacteria bacterium CG_4_9_14_0_2_um_filter_42_21]